MLVHVPRLDGYFENALPILRKSLDSLLTTTTGRAAVTVIANGCCEPVLTELEGYRRRGRLDQLVVNARNLGKVDALISAAKGAFDPVSR